MKSCELAKRADLAMAVSFTIVLQLVNIVAVPLWAKGIITGATVNPGASSATCCSSSWRR